MKTTKEIWGIRLKVIAPLLLLGLLFSACENTIESEKKLDNLRQIAIQTPVYPGFNRTFSNTLLKGSVADLLFYYKSSANYAAVKSFYVEALTARGWKLDQEKVYNRLLDGEGRELVFINGEYTIFVQYENGSTSDWNFSVTYEWQKP